MSEIEIPADGAKSWKYLRQPREIEGISGVHALWIERVSDLAVHLLAGWMRSEFEREHWLREAPLNDRIICAVCIGYGDDLRVDARHAYKPEQWSDAARNLLSK